MAYAYYLDGSLKTFTFPSLRRQSITYDNGGRALGTTAALPTYSATTYASGVGYWPNGAMQQVTTGAPSIAATMQYCQNTRFQITGIRVGSTSPWSLTTNCTGPLTPPAGDTLFLGFNYGAPGANNGNVLSEQIVTSSSVNVTQNFTYDAYNRILTANEMLGSVQGWSQPYQYDAWGNRAVGPGGYILNADLTPTALSQFTNNQWVPGTAYKYDGGNQISTGSKNSPGTVANSFTYDGENRLLTANIANTGNVSYVYDGEGRRVQKTVGTNVTNFVYDANGQLVAEYWSQPPPTGGTSYLFDDHLGSTRLFVNASIPGMVKRYDYVPFGEEIPTGMDGRGNDYGAAEVIPSGPDVVDQKFTGKERDNETGLDYFGARYFSDAQGRFTSPDWSVTPVLIPFADIDDPQTLNLYAYVRNNPMRQADADGHGLWTRFLNCFRYDGSCRETSDIDAAATKDIVKGIEGNAKTASEETKLKQLVASMSADDRISLWVKSKKSTESDTSPPSSPAGPAGPPRARYENPGHQDTSSPQYGGARKTPLPNDAEQVYDSAIRDPNRGPGTAEVYYGQNAKGEYYRYTGQNGVVHWAGTVSREEVPNFLRKLLKP